MNDLDLYVKTNSGIMYPNGGSSRDSKNTVERIHFTPENGSEVRVIVDAKNLATYQQAYSLAITGCFSRQQTSDTLTQQEFSVGSLASTRSLCPSDRLFQMELSADIYKQQELTWNLIKISDDGGIEELFNGSSDNEDGIVPTSCLDASSKYRFQMRSSSGAVIQGQYQLTYGGTVIFNSQLTQLGRVSTLRFETDGSGVYHQQGRNSYATHVKFSNSAEIGAEGSSSTSYSSTWSSEDSGPTYLADEEEEEDEGSESVGVIDYESLSMQVVDYQSMSMSIPLFDEEKSI